jgi:hypothetical protein
LKRAAVRGAPVGPVSSNSTPLAAVGNASLDCARASPLSGQRAINIGSLAHACKTAKQHPAQTILRKIRRIMMGFSQRCRKASRE